MTQRELQSLKPVLVEIEDGLELASIGLNQGLGSMEMIRGLIQLACSPARRIPSDLKDSALENLHSLEIGQINSEADARKEIARIRSLLKKLEVTLNRDPSIMSVWSRWWPHLKPQRFFLVFFLVAVSSLGGLRLFFKPKPFLEPELATSAKVHSFRYTFSKPTGKWNTLEFSDAKWSEGKSPFGAGYGGENKPNTEWKTPEIWLRREFQVESIPKKPMTLTILHDEDVEVYLNGTAILQKKGYETTYARVTLTEKETQLLKIGKNILAAHCRNKEGPGFINFDID